MKMNNDKKPEIIVFAGPNGSGKTTVTMLAKIIQPYINADEIKKNLLCEDLEAAKIAEGRPVLIFPEGTRRRPGDEPVYKPGVALLYQHLNLPVIPIATNTGFFWQKSSFLRHPGKVVFEFLEPINPGLDKKQFMAELQQRLESKCDELNRETIRNYPEVADRLIKRN